MVNNNPLGGGEERKTMFYLINSKGEYIYHNKSYYEVIKKKNELTKKGIKTKLTG